MPSTNSLADRLDAGQRASKRSLPSGGVGAGSRFPAMRAGANFFAAMKESRQSPGKITSDIQSQRGWLLFCLTRIADQCARLRKRLVRSRTREDGTDEPAARRL